MLESFRAARCRMMIAPEKRDRTPHRPERADLGTPAGRSPGPVALLFAAWALFTALGIIG